MSRAKAWQYRAGPRGSQVTVYERPDRGGQLYARVWDGDRPIKRSLGNMTREEAVSFAEAEARRLAEGAQALRQGRITFGVIVDMYLREVTPTKAAKTQKGDRRAAELWRRYLGADAYPVRVGLAEWNAFQRDRASGAIDARGNAVPAKDRRPVRARTVEANLRWLHAVLRWASRYRAPATGRPLLPENPVRGMDFPEEKNPHSEAVTESRFRAMLRAAEHVSMECRWAGKRETRPSFLPQLLTLANATGRRISSILALRASDLHLARTDDAPDGAITWRSEHDKEGYTWHCVPMFPEAREAVDALLRTRPAVGDALLFPSPARENRPVSKDLANSWYRAAEAVALEKGWLDQPMPPGRTFHGFRAKFATETQGLADKSRAYLGGWRSADTLRQCYDKVDADSLLDVIRQRGQLRKVREA